jgi:hypothetical protein
MKEQYTKQESSEILAEQKAEFLANGGVITKVKTKKEPRWFRGKAVMGPSKRKGSKGKSA